VSCSGVDCAADPRSGGQPPLDGSTPQQLGSADDALLLMRKVPPQRRPEAKHCGHRQIMAGEAFVNVSLSTIDDWPA